MANIDQTVATMLRDELKALGHIDGKTFRLEFRLADGDPVRLSEIATALVRDEPSVIVASGEAAIRAVQAATHTIPIVANANDLVASGLIASLAKPGGNITGVSMLITELDAKRLEMLKEILPSSRRFGVLNDPAAIGTAGLQAIADMARAQGVSLLRWTYITPRKFLPLLKAYETRVSMASTFYLLRYSQGFANSSAGCSSPTSSRRYASGAKWPLSDVWRAMARRTASSRR
jgi:ABC-type uncharacterized transport system substrate-binding protein